MQMVPEREVRVTTCVCVCSERGRGDCRERCKATVNRGGQDSSTAHKMLVSCPWSWITLHQVSKFSCCLSMQHQRMSFRLRERLRQGHKCIWQAVWRQTSPTTECTTATNGEHQTRVIGSLRSSHSAAPECLSLWTRQRGWKTATAFQASWKSTYVSD